jgi:ABC-type Fe3+/spermidine/putrescine transport system ATPase subunit
MVFQNYALFPHLTARRNVAFGLEVRGFPRAERERRVEAILDRVGLSQAERDRRPRALSGGQQQRVALARALVIEPPLLLLDEPLANLDRGLREQLRGELRRVQRQAGVTAMLVTHDQEEALALADRVGVMHAGRLLQLAAPRELYERPRTPFVARFLGDANLLPGEQVGRRGEVLLLRPEQCVLGDRARGSSHAWTGRVLDVAFLGADVLATIRVADDLTLRVRARAADAAGLTPGAEVDLGLPEGDLWSIPERDPEEAPGVR